MLSSDLILCPVSLHDESGQQEDIVNYIACFVHSDRRMGERWRGGGQGSSYQDVIGKGGRHVSVLSSGFMRMLKME